ncbi:hypothetical protein B0H17DRAFT_1032336 [Mycena rosella]|uniref:Uncharacterized protein n=1 Tax=Mycena rosella TaxID=1033263 RepID=A0AAD7GZF7_MYCRO|nr:hypothetical protein B0H17DRAFT_1032336 [Mycena rosella]
MRAPLRAPTGPERYASVHRADASFQIRQPGTPAAAKFKCPPPGLETDGSRNRGCRAGRLRANHRRHRESLRCDRMLYANYEASSRNCWGMGRGQRQRDLGRVVHFGAFCIPTFISGVHYG